VEAISSEKACPKEIYRRTKGWAAGSLAKEIICLAGIEVRVVREVKPGIYTERVGDNTKTQDTRGKRRDWVFTTKKNVTHVYSLETGPPVLLGKPG